MEEALRKTASQRNTTYRRKHKKILIYNLKAYRKILIQLIISCLILISIITVKGVDNPLTKDAMKRMNDCISVNIDWSNAYKGIQTWFSSIIDYSKPFLRKNDKTNTKDKTENVKDKTNNKASPIQKTSTIETKAIAPIDSKKVNNQEILPVFSSMNSMDIDVKYIKSKYKLASPVKGTISSRFGLRTNPISHKEELHPGVDIPANTGILIHAVLTGEVIEARKGTTFGNFVKIKSGSNVVSVYAHCSKILVKKGQKVLKGQNIAKVGSTGMSSGPHVHFEVWRDSRPVDPSLLLSFK